MLFSKEKTSNKYTQCYLKSLLSNVNQILLEFVPKNNNDYVDAVTSKLKL